MLDNLSPSDAARIEKAVSVLSRDGLVVYPTETVYGLGADALSEPAVIKVFESKQRLLGKPISVAVSDLEMITESHTLMSSQKSSSTASFQVRLRLFFRLKALFRETYPAVQEPLESASLTTRLLSH